MATSRTSVALDAKMRNRLNALSQIFGRDLGTVIRMGLELLHTYTKEYLEERKDVDPTAKDALEYLTLVEEKAPEKPLLSISAVKKFAEKKIDERDKYEPPEEVFKESIED